MGLNKVVDFSTAKLLKEKNFNKRSGLFPYNYNNIGELTLLEGLNAPTITEVVMWLYEKYGIWISVYQYKDHAADVNDDYMFRSNYTKIREYKTPKEAYEAAIEYTLKHLI